MKLALVMLLLSQAPDAPVDVVLTPTEAKAEAKRVLVCEADLKDCQANGAVSPMWLVVGVSSGVVAGVLIGLAAGLAKK